MSQALIQSKTVITQNTGTSKTMVCRRMRLLIV